MKGGVCLGNQCALADIVVVAQFTVRGFEQGEQAVLGALVPGQAGSQFGDGDSGNLGLRVLDGILEQAPEPADTSRTGPMSFA